MDEQEYQTRRAAIERDWAGLPGMTSVLLRELDEQRRGATAPPPVVDYAREARVRRIIEDTGVDRREAERRIAVADGTVALEDMTAGELREHLAATYAGQMDPSPQPVEDNRSHGEAEADLAAQWAAAQGKPALAFPEGQDALYARMEERQRVISGRAAREEAEARMAEAKVIIEKLGG